MTFRAGPKQLMIHTADERSTPSGLTVHVRGGSGSLAYNPPIVNVPAPSSNAHALQNAIDGASGGALLVLAKGTYEENVIMNKAVILQGSGPGGNVQSSAGPNIEPEPSPLLPGTAISGRFFNSMATYWRNKLNQMKPFSGNQAVPEAAAITVIAKSSGTNSAAHLRTGTFPTSGITRARIDGIYVKTSQGMGAGGIQVNAYGRNLQITNDVVEGNAGESAGGIGLGIPSYSGNPALLDNQNDDVMIRYSRIDGNGARTNAGGIGVFNGANDYQIRNNTICSNYSFNYGAGISHYGRSLRGRIADNKIYYNDAFDSGAGVTISGEILPGNPIGPGSGPVDVDRNLISGNFSGDDGGALFVQNALTQRINLRNNMMVNNGAAHSGGAMTMLNSSNVAIVNNTIAYNSATGTGEGRDGLPHAGAINSEVSNPLFAPVGAPNYSRPVVMYNNVFTENHAFSLNLTTNPASLDDLGLMDFEVSGTSGRFRPVRSILSTPYPPVPPFSAANPSNPFNQPGANPLFAAPFVNEFVVTGSRVDPQLVSVTINRPNPPNGIVGDYHIGAGSPAIDAGVFGSPSFFVGGERQHTPVVRDDDRFRIEFAWHQRFADENFTRSFRIDRTEVHGAAFDQGQSEQGDLFVRDHLPA